MEFTGEELVKIWETSRLSQRELAKMLNLNFNSMHGKLFRAQKRHTRREGVLKTKSYPNVELKAAVFDLETANFITGGTNGYLICCSVLPLGTDEVTTVRLEFDEECDDRLLLTHTVEVLNEYDILIGHNIASFDFNWLNSRLMYHNMNELDKRWLYYDTYQASRRLAIKAHRKSLGFLGDFFRIDGVKTSVLPVSWSMVSSRDQDEFEEAMDDIIYHCEQDVLLNRNLFDVLWPRDNKAMVNLPMTKKW